MNKIIISHGDKGGAGKSVVAAVTVDYFLEMGVSTALVEGDLKTPDVGRRYKSDPRLVVGAIPLNRAGAAEEAIGKLADWIEAQRPEVVIINLPAGGGDTMDNLAPVLRQVADALEYQVRITYSLDKGEDAWKALAESLEKGLMSVVDPECRWVIYPAFKGAPETFAWAKKPERKKYNIPELVMPALIPVDVWDRVMTFPGGFSDLLKNPPEGMTKYTQITIDRWLRTSRVALNGVLS